MGVWEGETLAVALRYSCNMIAHRLAEQCVWCWLYGRVLAMVQVGERGRVASWFAYLLVTVACDCTALPVSAGACQSGIPMRPAPPGHNAVVYCCVITGCHGVLAAVLSDPHWRPLTYLLHNCTCLYAVKCKKATLNCVDTGELVPFS